MRLAGKKQAGRFAERVVDGVDDGGTPERVVIWIERKDGGVWAVGRAVNPQHRPSDEPRAGDYVFEGYELQDALDAANETLEDDVSVAEGDGSTTRQPPFRRSEILGPLERWFFGTSEVILVVAATERELAASGAPDTLCCGIGPAEAGIRTAMGLAELRPDAVLHVGIAGAPELEPLSVVIGSEAHYADIVDPSSLMPKVERAYPAPELVEAARRALPDAQVLPIASCARVGGGGECHVEAMEGFSVLRAAELAGVPAVEVRTISNRPAESDRGLWRIDDALARLGEIVPPLLEELQLCVR